MKMLVRYKDGRAKLYVGVSASEAREWSERNDVASVTVWRVAGTRTVLKR